MCIASRGGISLSFAVVPALLLSCLAATPADAADLDHALLRQAPGVLTFLREHGHRNVGVLKFAVQKGDGRPSDNAGLLNLEVAHRLEVALVLSNPLDERKQLGILHDASRVAAGIKGANHLTEEGRRRLFATRYPLAWGKQEVEADAFLTGTVRIAADRRRLEVRLLAFGKDGKEPAEVAFFGADSDPHSLGTAGESFLLRGGSDDGEAKLVSDKAARAAGRVQGGEQEHPLRDASAPVALEVRYDDRPVQVQIRDGQAEVPEPAEGQKVSFVLRRTAAADPRRSYGVVLKVNGENTLYRQRLPELECRKWILDPGDGPTTIRGFQTTSKEVRPFVVSSREESKANEFNYGADVGTVSLVVFPEKKGGDEAVLDLSDVAEDLPAISRGLFPKEPPKNLAALKARLRNGAVDRGLIEEGKEKVQSGVTTVQFQPDPTLVLAATIRYYRR
jgi:hypothetical protein